MEKKKSHKKDPYLLDCIDSKEKIAQCLQCPQEECTNCFYTMGLKRYGKKES